LGWWARDLRIKTRAVHHLFIDHVERDCIDDLYKIDLPKVGQPAPVVNMVATCQVLDDSLNNILDESPGAYSEGSTETISSCPLSRRDSG
jgi:hypothetical protein